jgi:transcriptional regulator with XRE-family HTH domain
MLKRKVIELPEEIAPIMKEMGLKVAEYRKKAHPNYRKFAEQKKLNVMTLWRVQNGEDVKLSSFLLILKKVGVSPQDFFNGFTW